MNPEPDSLEEGCETHGCRQNKLMTRKEELVGGLGFRVEVRNFMLNHPGPNSCSWRSLYTLNTTFVEAKEAE